MKKKLKLNKLNKKAMNSIDGGVTIHVLPTCYCACVKPITSQDTSSNRLRIMRAGSFVHITI